MPDEVKPTRLNKAAAELNVGISTIVEFLHKKGIVIEENPNTKITPEIFALLVKEYQSDKAAKDEAKKIGLSFVKHESITLDEKGTKARAPEREPEQDELIIKSSAVDDTITQKEKKPAAAKKPAEEEKPAPKPAPKEAKEPEPEKAPEIKPVVATPEPTPGPVVEEKPVVAPAEAEIPTDSPIKVLGKIDLDSINLKTRPAKKTKEEKKAEAHRKFEKTKAKPAEEEPTAEIIPEDKEEVVVAVTPEPEPVVVEPVKEEPPAEKKPHRDANFIPTRVEKLDGPKIFGKIELPVEKKPEKKPVASSTDDKLQLKKKKRKRIKQEKYQEPVAQQESKERQKPGAKKRQVFKPEPSEEEIQKQIKETLARLAPSGKSKTSKYRRQKRDSIREEIEIDRQKAEEDKKILKVTEFVTVNEMANMMNVPVINIISTFMQLGMFVSINQRLNAESLALVAEEFGYKVEFVDVSVQEALELTQEEDKEEDLVDRPPIVTVMGHVDHGKTKLLDFIRNTNVVAGEAGGITQHIGAYEVQLESGKKITFLDTPGHEAFTAMRARGALVTDVVIIVIAADDDVMPQTVEAINHAQAGGVPLVFAINKVDKPTANPEKIKEQLAKMNILVEDWGGKYQSQEISAKQGLNVGLLLDKVLLEAELLELKGNPNRLALGTVLESSLDKGRGYVAKVMVQNGTLKVGDMVLAGAHFGRVKAMYNERNQRVDLAGPSTPVLLLGLDGAPQAGDKFNVMKDEKEAKAIANKRLQLQREQGIRSQKHITLDEIGRRIAIGDFKELNLIVKGDVDGSVEALSDSLLKLSTKEVQVNVIHKSVGQVTESDVLLASASNAIIVGFQVRPSLSARKLAEKEEIEIRSYSIIYQAIEEIKAAIEGMLSPEIEEKITSNLEIREVFKISKVGTIAGCHVLDGKITRNTRIRLIRNGIVVYTGRLGSLKRFKDDVKEVAAGFECGLNIDNFNDIKEGDIIEGFEEVEIKRKL
ncbi:MAG TPA: translation initiation factor IF-2 [Bacteroidales bacterium]|nr:translation initiation factor IF-2 [Bacteroidales bacterium]HPI85620.1 translation initiation factor IF-2 [Bacteroidales bacterium]HPM93150.1 translation initiation factor IF-2 [Bacteroidales bacterium]